MLCIGITIHIYAICYLIAQRIRLPPIVPQCYADYAQMQDAVKSSFGRKRTQTHTENEEISVDRYIKIEFLQPTPVLP